MMGFFEKMFTKNTDAKSLLTVFCFLSVIISEVVGLEESVSINRPRNRSQQLPSLVSTDHVRCFCNLPPCVATGYMCKSSGGGCFSDVLDSSRTSVYRGRHGCIENLTESQRSRCAINDGDVQTRPQSKEHPRSLLVCCTNDMCNHVDSPATRNLLNNTFGNDFERKLQHQEQDGFLYSNSEVWFRAATIAVPICGAVILFALIALAVKILKSENQNAVHYKLGPAMYVVPSRQKNHKWSDRPYKPCTVKQPYYPTNPAHPNAFALRTVQNTDTQFQVPLLGSNEVTSVSGGPVIGSTENKNDAYAKLNELQCRSNSSKSIILEIGKSTQDCSLMANMNINADEEKFGVKEKVLIS